MNKVSGDRNTPPPIYNFDKLKNSDIQFGHHVRVEGGDVKLDSHIGRVARETLANLGLRRKVTYADKYETKLAILEVAASQQIGNRKITNIANILTHEVVRDPKIFGEQTSDIVNTGVRYEQTMLMNKLMEDPLVNEIANSILNSSKLNADQLLNKLTEYGVDLKKEKIIPEKFIDIFIKGKTAGTNIDAEALRSVLIDKFQKARLMEALSSHDPKGDASKIFQDLIHADYSYLRKSDK